MNWIKNIKNFITNINSKHDGEIEKLEERISQLEIANVAILKHLMNIDKNIKLAKKRKSLSEGFGGNNTKSENPPTYH